MDKSSRAEMAGLVINEHVRDEEIDRVVDYLGQTDTNALGIAVMAKHFGKDFRAEFERVDQDASGTICKIEFRRYLQDICPHILPEDESSRPSNSQLALFFLNSAIPFLVFGCLDNSIMIVGGDVVDDLIGSTFKLSTLACAGLANTFADVLGISIGNTVEALTKRLGLPTAKLTPAQAESKLVRRLGLLAGSAGILVGCLLGMFPLLFMDQDKKVLKDAFARLDRDGNGTLDVDEIQQLLQTLGLEVPDKKVLQGLMRVDPNGKITFADFASGFSKLKD